MILTHVWDRIACVWRWEWLAEARWAALPHVAAGATLACVAVGGGLWWRNLPPPVPMMPPPYPPVWTEPAPDDEAGGPGWVSVPLGPNGGALIAYPGGAWEWQGTPEQMSEAFPPSPSEAQMIAIPPEAFPEPFPGVGPRERVDTPEPSSGGLLAGAVAVLGAFLGWRKR